MTEADPSTGSWDPTVPLATGEVVVSEQTTGYTPIDAAGDLDPTSGWLLGQATVSTTVVPGGDDVVAKSRFDSLGRVVESRQPASDGTDAGTALSDYYTVGPQAGPAAVCGSRPEWAGLACQTRTPETTPTLPVERTTGYSLYLAPTTVTETLASTVRITTTSYDAAGRTVRSQTATTGLTGSEPVPVVVTEYDSATGLVAATVALDPVTLAEIGRIGHGYDGWGRETSYAAAGQTTTTVFDTAARVAQVVDPTGTTTFGYDQAGQEYGGR